MKLPIPKTLRLFRRWLHDQRGGEAIEMAVVGVPFMALVFGLIELGLVFLVSTTLDNALDEASRKIRTGQAQVAGQDAGAIKAVICDEMSWLGSSCAANLNLDVRTFANFSSQGKPPNPIVGGKVTPTNFCFDPGGAGSIVLVRAYYTWKLILPVLNTSLVNIGGGKRLITAAVSFRNEPYENTPAAPVPCPKPI